MDTPCPTPPLVGPRAQEDALPFPDPFDELTSADLISSTGEEATRPTVRIEAAPSPWWATRWWAGVAVAIAAVVAGGRLVDSRRSVTRNRVQHPAKRSHARWPRVEPAPPSDGRAKPVASPPARRSRSRRPLRGVTASKSHSFLERRTRSEAAAAPAAVSPAAAAAPVAGAPVAREPVARPQKPTESQFGYLGE